MKPIIIGTAGHIDHGKTALVKALTGIDADRLEEEKRRGITIDIGFAHLELPGPGGEIIKLGFVDVPGHERFVRNMLAGVGGIDFVLLVIAADESIKPQTREHFDICRLLSVKRGITVLTKADLVDAETLDVVKMEVGEFLRASFLDGSPILPISSLTGAGIDDLKRALAQAAVEAPARDPASLARLPIDRVFIMKGFGTVVTGTLVAGTIHKEDEMEVFPTGQRVRVRGVQVHGEAAEHAIARQRTALNLAGASADELGRGMMLAPPATLHSTYRADVSLSLLASAKPLKDRARVHLHAHTAETIATVAHYGKKQISPGETGFAQLRLAEPLLLLPGDRFILRQFSPVVTIGGGVVLDASPLPKFPKQTHQAFLETLAGSDAAQILQARIARRRSSGLSLDQAIAETGWPRAVVDARVRELAERRQVVRVGERVLSAASVEELKLSLLQIVSEFHKRNPLVAGMNREALREEAGTTPEIFSFTLDLLGCAKTLEAAGESVRLPGHGVVMKDDEAESKKTIEKAFLSAGLKVPALKEVLAVVRVDASRAQKIVTLLLRDKVLVKISEDLVFHRDVLGELRCQMAAEKAKSPKMDVGRFKDLTGVSRKYAIPLLEYLDREHVTRRVGDERVIL